MQFNGNQTPNQLQLLVGEEKQEVLEAPRGGLCF